METVNKNISEEAEFDNFNFEEFIDEFKDKVVNVCFSYTNNLEDAEDVSQEVFIEVYRSFKNFKNESSLSTWIYRIASNKSIDYLRKQKRLKRGNGRISYLEDFSRQDFASSAGSNTDDPLIQEQRKELLYNAISKLKDKQKQAFVLTQIEGMSQQHTAEVMKTTVKSVESLVMRARNKLKQMLEKQIKHYI